ncbi:atrial natriuretic peptide-converting enzyme-like isoform X1 [Vespa mandarinia]|uniref:atrial natriuretic peptide-converting enzyme-like isoform X1 n=1 Tax=Vespa mandarinia TaxID=7446 RepID=UPI001609D63E|nr:atrial natriuretic peptide-converting enzyme-like isoform X1 [Vespa mandarinia]XP_035736420.1 atrial natriuretic peptide-converting enzyme-like isoform X1 [Vespa mandarinia]XP_035736421.1 atrial natriuretic peptide-converting enzyme-like isoform X1 [Vespa mandarinia]
MTVTMEHKRKSSWDSKKFHSVLRDHPQISVSTVSTRRFSRAGTPSSILSSDSDIRFTRKLGGQYRCGCCVLAAFLLFLLFSGVSIYLGYTFLTSDSPGDQIFLATFRVTDGDYFALELADPSTEAFRIRSREYRDRINLIFRRSWLKLSFLASDILALDGVEGRDLVVHFDVRFDPRYQTITTSDVVDILSREIDPTSTKYLSNLTIDAKSLEVQESLTALNAQVSLQTTVSTIPPTTTAPPPRRCSLLELSYCKHLPYNVTSYPNILGHRSLIDVEEDVIAFRELVDAECYRSAYDFVCQVLQPACLSGDPEDLLQLPCRSFCREFWNGCGNRLSERIKRALDCSNFPEYADVGSCRPKPGCVQTLQSKALSPRICDGIIDCPDLADEKNCAYCRDGYMHCGIGRTCIPHVKRCDGKIDCPNGSDEKDCLSLAQSIRAVKSQPWDTPHAAKYNNEGYVVFNEKGTIGKLCTENLNATMPATEMETVLQTVANSLCTLLTYTGVKSVEVRIDEEEDVQYVHMEDPSATEITFVRAPCPSKDVMYIRCSELECGVQPLRNKGKQGLSKMAEPGDWPWHAALFKEEVHVCDATLIAENWLLTTASCFQGQPKAEWSARLGTVRLSSTSPWQQERRIVGMIKSPVEGSTTVLLKLDRPVATYSDFVRPVCLPSAQDPPSTNASQCNTLGWARNRDMLQRVQLRHSAMERCENISIASVNSVCTEPAYSVDDCNEEEVAGSPMLCLQAGGQTWALTGVGSWRIACSKAGVERPRLYDQISSNIAWIKSTIS